LQTTFRKDNLDWSLAQWDECVCERVRRVKRAIEGRERERRRKEET